MQQVIYRDMRKGEKRNPKYLEGKPCKTCGTTTKISVYRIRPKQRDNIIYYKAVDLEREFGKVERIKTYRCWECAKRKSIKNNPNNDTLSWQRKNREHLRAYQREYYKDKYKARNGINAKRLRERQVYDDKKEIAEFYRNCPKGYHVDHIIPLNGENISGLHTIGNLQYLLATENLRKSNKF